MNRIRIGIFIASFVIALVVSQIITNDKIGGSGTVSATGAFVATGGQLVTGSEVALSSTNNGTWKAVLAFDTKAWVTARDAVSGLNKQIYYDGVQQLGANKLIFTIVDNNILVADSFTHQICDWVSSTGVDNAADADCTGGGWRNLSSVGTTHTHTSASTRSYEVYDGYYWSSAVAGTTISTPVSNFIKTGNGRVLFRVYSAVASTTQHSLDRATLEVAVDPIYDVASMVNTSGGTITGTTNRFNLSDNVRFSAAMPAISTPIENIFYFENIKTYTGANTLMVNHEICASAVSMTYTVSLWNFQTSSWTAHSKTFTPTVCSTDTDNIIVFNSTAVSGFVLSDYISAGQVRMRILTAAPASVQTIQYDHLMVMVGSVNTDTANCEISWGTNASNDCAATRNTEEARTAAATTSVWGVTSAAEYTDSDHYSQDNDDDATGSEHAVAVNISVPVEPSAGSVVTAIHYAVKFRSGSTTMRLDPSIRDYSANQGTSGWMDTPGTDLNASATTYTFGDTWNVAEIQTSAPFFINKDTGLMNIRFRTSTSTLTASSATSSFDFVMGSIRWVENSSFENINPYGPPTGSLLVTGNEVATSATNTGSWRGVMGNDANTWTFERTASGAQALFYFDNVVLHNANKLIIKTEAANVSAGAESFSYQICDWISTTAVTVVADANCTGGGWRSLNPRATATAGFTGTTSTTREFRIFDGFFVDRSGASPGVIVSTPLSNFVRSSDGRVLVRIISSDNSSNRIAVDVMSTEVAIDPVYEPVGVTVTAGGVTTGYVSDLTGAPATNINGSDGNKFVIPQSATLTPVDVSFVFEDVELATGMNTVVFSPEICATSASMIFQVYMWKYSNSSWTSLGVSTTPTTCGSDTEYAFAFNPDTVSGFDIDNHVSGSGQMKFRVLTASGVAATPSIQFDRLYAIVGAVNASTSSCEIGWGTGTDANCTNTRTVAEGKATAPTTSVWDATSVTELNETNYWPYDSDEDATSGESANSFNLGFNISLPQYSSPTAVHYAIKYRSGASAMTLEPQFKTFDPNYGTGSWYSTPGSDNNAGATTYSWFDTWILSPVIISPLHVYNAGTGDMAMRFRTTVSTASASTISSIDFAMTSLRWVSDASPIISITVDDGAIAYGYVPLSGSKDTTVTGVNDTQHITNDGNAAVDLNVKGYDTACWTLANTIGVDQYTHQFSITGGAPWSNLQTTYQTLTTGLNESAVQDSDFRITLPSSTACMTEQTAQITLQAVES